MKFAICNETFQDWPFEKAFAYARQAGYTGIELAPFTMANDVREIPAARRAEVRALAESHDLAVVGLHWLLAKTEGYHLTSPDADVRARTRDYLAELTRLCRELGGDTMVFGSPQQRNLLTGVSLPQATDHAIDVLTGVLPVLEEQDVTLALEPLGPAEGDFWVTASEVVGTIEQINSPRIRLHLDVKAMSSENKPISDVIRAGAPHLVHFHANDPNRRGPGMGEVDFVPIFETLREIHYDRWVSVEVFDYEPGVERLVDDSIRYMNECLQQLG